MKSVGSSFGHSNDHYAVGSENPHSSVEPPNRRSDHITEGWVTQRKIRSQNGKSGHINGRSDHTNRRSCHGTEQHKIRSDNRRDGYVSTVVDTGVCLELSE